LSYPKQVNFDLEGKRETVGKGMEASEWKALILCPSQIPPALHMQLKYVALNDGLYRYACEQRSDAGDPVLAALRRETEIFGEDAKCQISEEQGAFMRLLVAAIGAKSAIEVGTFTGYSSICIARGLGPDGHLICIDRNEEWTNVARRYWAKAGVESRIELRLGAATTLLERLDPKFVFDFAFIDAAKDQYDAYYELILPHIRQNGLILLDNMLWGGRLALDSVPENPLGKSIDALNRKLAKDERVEVVLLPIADGIQVCRKR
jgi:caffeoyl-CoA O-methyltransferase